MANRNFKYNCAVNGVVVVVYGYPRKPISGICPYMSVGDNSKCLAHGNKKCQHKSKVTSQ